MKGKHKRARGRRDSADMVAAIGRLRAEIEAETTRARRAHHAAAQARTARARLQQEVKRNDELLAELTHDASDLAAAVGPAWAAIGAVLAELRTIEKKLSTNTTTRGLEEFVQAGFKLRLVDVHRSADASYRSAWYRKRTRQRLYSTRGISLHGWVPPEVPNDRAALAPYATCTVRDDTPEARRVWAVPPWLRPPTDNTDASILRALLGATSAATTAPGDAPSSGGLRHDAAVSTPWRHTPSILEPADAADLTYWYRRSALSQSWRPTTDPVPFWLPAEHSVGYPQARALPNGTPLRLPYPAVFVALSSPWQLNPSPAGEPAPNDAIRTLMLYARSRAAHGQAETLSTVLNRLHAAGSIERKDLPTPLQAVSHYGGQVEGVILTANADGEPEDDFAWCIAIGHPTGLPLGRIAVPASRSGTAWRTQIDNLLARVALSSWHEPGEAPSSRAGAGARHDVERHDPEVTVRVLNIDDTSPASLPSPKEGSGQTPRPHLRRGHWRRQPVGHRRTDTRWTWVRPTTVGGTKLFTRQVYVLPIRR